MTFALGLTGSMGMGKSTTAQMFADHGCAIWDADASVHKLYQPGGAAVSPIGESFPTAIINGQVDRTRLKQILAADPRNFDVLNSIVHPLVRQDRAQFKARFKHGITVFDIPLLFETQSQGEFDATACVMTTPEKQMNRIMARGTMTLEQAQAIIDQQWPIAKKTALADFVICTDTLVTARRDVDMVMDQIKGRQMNA